MLTKLPYRKQKIPVSEQNAGDFTWGSSSQAVTHLRLLSTPDALPQIRALVVGSAEKLGFDAENIAKIEMAVGEACTNIIEHGYQTQPLRDQIEVVVETFPDRMEITLLDYSTVNFPVDAMPGIALDEYIETQRSRGLGLYIIRTFVDHIEHRFVCGQGNQLRLIKFLA